MRSAGTSLVPDEEPQRPERDALGILIDWAGWEARGLAMLRTDRAKAWKVDCRCEHPDPRWMLVASPLGEQYDRWLLHYHHEHDCPAMKVPMAGQN